MWIFSIEKLTEEKLKLYSPLQRLHLDYGNNFDFSSWSLLNSALQFVFLNSQ